ncbi:SGNH hydrolase-type esterase domain-containing protein [Ampelomyces quisqualis]|uniref:SGNH hydrolase-type esterase domain-containing protein n=1 Tax=Ampelomyces quisqualis TaxID=50730 RepID=A0A6A5QV95_AMPQU|nr:SGNH hydrolase-type esterase domain-containing protein [Ampelomyces quisqualis]
MMLWLSLVLWASCLSAFVCAAPSYNSSVLSFSNGTASRGSAFVKKSFVWSALGDSWASGVSYDLLGRTDYDDNKDNCMRINHAYAVKLSEDDTWVPNGLKQEFHFQACSGTRFEQIDRGTNQDHIQLNEIPADTNMLLLQAGGNNANFAAIAYACLFAPEGKEWGPAFPDPRGACAVELAKAREYIYGTGVNQLFQDTRWTVNAVFNNEKVKHMDDLRLFIPGYFQSFYEGGGAGDWCDNASFALRYSDRPTLSLALRKEINGLIRGLNDGIKAGIVGSFHHHRTHFIDVDSQIGDHRFCQPGHSLYDQYFGDKVYLWNMSPEGVIIGAGASGGLVKGNGTYEVREPTPEEFEHWRKTGFFTNDPREVQTNMTTIARAQMAKADGVALGNDSEWLNEIGLHQNKFPGVALRPFHPKENGHFAMAQAIRQTIQANYDIAPFAGASGLEVPWTRSIQILFRETGRKFSWFMFVGPFGKSVDPCLWEAAGFQQIVANYPETRKGLSLMDPPYVGYGTRWEIEFPGQWDCRYEAGQNDPGALKCGQYLDYPFYHDARNTRMTCNSKSKNYGTFHRAWTLEFII